MLSIMSCTEETLTKKIRILFVDDEPFILSGLKRMLRKEQKNWEMVFIESPFEAVEAVQENKFDIVVSDMRMPGMNGAILVSKVAELSPETARVILTGEADEESLKQAMALTNKILSKPCDSEALKNELRDIINQMA